MWKPEQDWQYFWWIFRLCEITKNPFLALIIVIQKSSLRSLLCTAKRHWISQNCFIFCYGMAWHEMKRMTKFIISKCLTKRKVPLAVSWVSALRSNPETILKIFNSNSFFYQKRKNSRFLISFLCSIIDFNAILRNNNFRAKIGNFLILI